MQSIELELKADNQIVVKVGKSRFTLTATSIGVGMDSLDGVEIAVEDHASSVQSTRAVRVFNSTK